MWGFTGVWVCGGRGSGTAGLERDSAAEHAELHGVLKPQSERPRPQNRTWKQKQTETQIREIIEKYILILLISGERECLHMATAQYEASE